MALYINVEHIFIEQMLANPLIKGLTLKVFKEPVTQSKLPMYYRLLILLIMALLMLKFETFGSSSNRYGSYHLR